MLHRRLIMCAAAGAVTLGISSLVIHADAQQTTGRAAAVSAPAVGAATVSTQAGATAVSDSAVQASQTAQSAERSAAVSASLSRTATAPQAPTAPEDIIVKDPLGVACIDVGARGCEANNVAVSTGGPAKACGNPHIALSPLTSEVEPCP